MTLVPLPTTVIAGYLGAGKTSLVNHLLRHPGGRRIMVMVNDFGALDIDADLLESADEDTVTLSNGCICCTMGTELMYALADACDRRPRPDALVIEASGVAQPEKIAAAAHAEPEMRYGGIITLADAANLASLLADAEIGDQIRGQLAVADLIGLTKIDLGDAGRARALLAEISAAPVIEVRDGAIEADLILDRPETSAPAAPARHDHGGMYRSWSSAGGVLLREPLGEVLARPPDGLYRFKARIALSDGEWVEAHRVGHVTSMTSCPPADETRAVAIGLADRFDPDEFDRCWRACLAT